MTSTSDSLITVNHPAVQTRRWSSSRKPGQRPSHRTGAAARPEPPATEDTSASAPASPASPTSRPSAPAPATESPAVGVLEGSAPAVAITTAEEAPLPLPPPPPLLATTTTRTRSAPTSAVAGPGIAAAAAPAMMATAAATPTSPTVGEATQVALVRRPQRCSLASGREQPPPAAAAVRMAETDEDSSARQGKRACSSVQPGAGTNEEFDQGAPPEPAGGTAAAAAVPTGAPASAVAVAAVTAAAPLPAAKSLESTPAASQGGRKGRVCLGCGATQTSRWHCWDRKPREDGSGIRRHTIGSSNGRSACHACYSRRLRAERRGAATAGGEGGVGSEGLQAGGGATTTAAAGKSNATAGSSGGGNASAVVLGAERPAAVAAAVQKEDSGVKRCGDCGATSTCRWHRHRAQPGGQICNTCHARRVRAAKRGAAQDAADAVRQQADSRKPSPSPSAAGAWTWPLRAHMAFRLTGSGPASPQPQPPPTQPPTSGVAASGASGTVGDEGREAGEVPCKRPRLDDKMSDRLREQQDQDEREQPGQSGVLPVFSCELAMLPSAPPHLLAMIQQPLPLFLPEELGKVQMTTSPGTDAGAAAAAAATSGSIGSSSGSGDAAAADADALAAVGSQPFSGPNSTAGLPAAAVAVAVATTVSDSADAAVSASEKVSVAAAVGQTVQGRALTIEVVWSAEVAAAALELAGALLAAAGG